VLEKVEALLQREYFSIKPETPKPKVNEEDQIQHQNMIHHER